MRNILDLRCPPPKTVIYRYVLGLCLCQDKPYGTIILTTISFSAYKDNWKLWSFYYFIFEHRQSYCISTEACFEFVGCFDIITITFLHAFVMLYNVSLSSCHPCDLTLLLFLLINNYPTRKTFFKWSIITELILSKMNQHFSGHQFAINKLYQIRRNIWQDIISNLN